MDGETQGAIRVQARGQTVLDTRALRRRTAPTYPQRRAYLAAPVARGPALGVVDATALGVVRRQAVRSGRRIWLLQRRVAPDLGPQLAGLPAAGHSAAV